MRIVWLTGLVLLFAAALAACAGAPLPGAHGLGAGCGDACATMQCPQSFRCSLTPQCQPHCEPEQAVPGRL